MTTRDPFKYFHSSREISRLAVMMNARFLLSPRNVEDLLHERGIDISHETVRFWWYRFGPIFASEVRMRRIEGMKSIRVAREDQRCRWWTVTATMGRNIRLDLSRFSIVRVSN